MTHTALFVGSMVEGHGPGAHEPGSSQYSQDATVASAQSLSSTPQPQSQRPSPKYVGSHVHPDMPPPLPLCATVTDELGPACMPPVPLVVVVGPVVEGPVPDPVLVLFNPPPEPTCIALAVLPSSSSKSALPVAQAPKATPVSRPNIQVRKRM
jgi:hypothetical protein